MSRTAVLLRAGHLRGPWTTGDVMLRRTPGGRRGWGTGSPGEQSHQGFAGQEPVAPWDLRLRGVEGTLRLILAKAVTKGNCILRTANHG